MVYLACILVAGINLSILLFARLDSWHAQGLFTQFMIFIMFAWSLFDNKVLKPVKNLPFMFLFSWIGIHTAFFCYQSQLSNKYDVAHFFVFFNFFCIVLLYQIMLKYVDYAGLKKILTVMRWSILVTLFVCVLQKLGLSQFFMLLFKDMPQYNNIMVGFIGNPTHLAGFLASQIPLFMMRKNREDYMALTLMIILLLTSTGTTMGQVAESGWVTAGAIFIFLFWKRVKNIFWIGAVLAIFLTIVYYWFPWDHYVNKELAENISNTLRTASNGRMPLWDFYWDLSRQFFLTGTGFGTVNIIYRSTPHPSARHVHNEPLQFLFEGGLICIILACCVIYYFFQKRDHPFTRETKAMVLGFLVSGLFNYPAHLWLPSVYCIVAYTAVFIIEREFNNGHFDAKANPGSLHPDDETRRLTDR